MEGSGAEYSRSGRITLRARKVPGIEDVKLPEVVLRCCCCS
jgi:hypothetical protein